MKTIVAAKDHIVKLWSSQSFKESEAYRMMHYVLKIEHNDITLLHNVMTGQLVALDFDESKALDSLPAMLDPILLPLIADHYLVPIDYDEYRQLKSLRSILRKLDATRGAQPIQKYNILPTTACNARCFYCFEKGIPFVTMDERTANDVVEFIDAHCGAERKVYISWFGGEPTVGSKRIDQISQGLKNRGIDYSSSMVTNGYLFDERMVAKASSQWNLISVQITLDGIESTYNRIKSYVHATGSPYKRVLRNIRLLAENDIKVHVRMNFDKNTYNEFSQFISDIENACGGNPNIKIYAHPILYTEDSENELLCGHTNWYARTEAELNAMSIEAGYRDQRDRLPFLRFKGCMVDRNVAMVVKPDGGLVRCPEQLGEEQNVGSVREGITNPNLIASWKEIIYPEMCSDCSFAPRCVRMAKCSGASICHGRDVLRQSYERAMKNAYSSSTEREVEDNDLQRAVSRLCAD